MIMCLGWEQVQHAKSVKQMEDIEKKFKKGESPGLLRKPD
jgi:hypothetical protein